MNNTKLYMLDLDGTLYVGDRVIDGAVEKVKEIINEGKSVCYLTNNSTRGKKQYAERLTNMGFPNAAENIYSSGTSAVEYVKYNFPDNPVYVLGTAALRQEFSEAGVNVLPFSKNTELLSFPQNKINDIVTVAAFNTELNYDNLNVACHLIKHGCEYAATNPDRTCPTTYGFMPDCGSLLAFIEAFSGRLPSVICGKPFSIMADGIYKKYGVEPSGAVMVGDSISSDIRFAVNNGFKSVLVLSGGTDFRTASESKIKADIVINSIRDLVIG